MTILFFLYTLLGIVSAACATIVFWISIQHDQWMDKLFGWQKMLDKFGSNSGMWNTIRYKALGGCEFCFSHFVTVLTFVCFVCFVCFQEGWFSTPSFTTQIISNIIFYLLFIVCGTVISFFTLTKGLKK